jgi:hypothetical protein
MRRPQRMDIPIPKTDMKIKYCSHVAVALTVLALMGCSSVPTKVDTGPIHARTFSFVSRGNRPVPGFVDDRQAVHEMIQNAITKDLAARGVTLAPTGGDVTVGYLIIIGNHVSTEAINDYFGYNQGAGELQDKAHEVYTNSKNPNDFEAGTLLIDITDSLDHRLLKRGYVTRMIGDNITPDERQQRIQAVVDEIFKNLRVEP